MSKLIHYLLLIFLSSQSMAFFNDYDREIQTLNEKIDKLEKQVKFVMESSDSERINDLEQRVINLQAQVNRHANASTAAVQMKSVDTDKAMIDIRRMIKNQELKRAEQALDRYIKSHKSGDNRSEALYYLGDIFVSQGELLKAEPMFNEVVTLNRHRLVPDALLRLVTIYWQTGQQDKASKTYKRLVTKYPNSSVSQLAKVQYQTWIDSN